MRDDLTLQENEISNMCVVHAFQEMIGGKGPDDEEKREHALILQRMWSGVNGKYQELLCSVILKVERT